MFVADIMHGPPITADVSQSLEEVYRRMQENKIRHLPVLRDGNLVGVVTDRDLRYATSSLNPRPFDPTDRVETMMSRDPVTASPRDPVEDAARLMRERKIGCLPVLENGDLVGIVTGTDLLDAIIQLTGLTRPSGRLEVCLSEQQEELPRLMTLLAERGLLIHSILSQSQEAECLRIILRVGTLNTRQLASDLREEGIDVVWPARRAWH